MSSQAVVTLNVLLEHSRLLFRECTRDANPRVKPSAERAVIEMSWLGGARIERAEFLGLEYVVRPSLVSSVRRRTPQARLRMTTNRSALLGHD